MSGEKAWPPFWLGRASPSRFDVALTMLDWLIHPGGYLSLFAFMVATGAGMPLPEEVAIVAAGVLSAQGTLQPQAAFVACLLGALVGDALMYGIGRRFGWSLLSRHPRLAKLLHADRGEDFERAIERHGFKVLLLARFMVGVRGPVYLTAGVVRMPFRRFMLWDVVCATLVVGCFFALSYYFGRDIARLLRQAEVLVTVVVLGVAAVVTFLALQRHRARLVEQVIKKVEELPTKGEERATRGEEAQRSAER